MPDGLLMLPNCFFDFAVEHWFDCNTTEPGFTGDIGAMEIWLIDLNKFISQGKNSAKVLPGVTLSKDKTASITHHNEMDWTLKLETYFIICGEY